MDFIKNHDFKNIKLPVKTRDAKLKKNPFGIFGHENKEKYPIYLSKNALQKNMNKY